MHMRIFPDRKRPKILKKEKIRHKVSPAVHMTVAAQPISSGIIRNVTCKEAEETSRADPLIHMISTIVYLNPRQTSLRALCTFF